MKQQQVVLAATVPDTFSMMTKGHIKNNFLWPLDYGHIIILLLMMPDGGLMTS